MTRWSITLTAVCMIVAGAANANELLYEMQSAAARGAIPSNGIKFRAPGVTEKDEWCAWDSAENICQVCYDEPLGRDHGSCINSSQPSASDCFAFCAPPAAAAGSCHYKAPSDGAAQCH